MEKIKCAECQGSGKYTKGGSIYHNCELCDGKGRVYPLEPRKEFKIDKESSHYKKAIKRIKALNKEISDQKAEEIFDKELNAINVKDDENGTASEKNSRTKSVGGYASCDTVLS
jgi:RecJ-like exonuclease